MKTIHLVLILLILAAATCVPAVAADEPTAFERLWGRSERFQVRLQVAQRYDDNILQLSRADIEAFRSNPDSSRFRIQSVDDQITRARLKVSSQWRLLPRRDTTFWASWRHSQYHRNNVKTYDGFSIGIRQELTASQTRLALFRLEAGFVNDFYLFELTDDDASFDARRRIRRSTTYDESRLSLLFEKELIEDRLEISAGRSWHRRDYNEFFNERDGTRREDVVGLTLRPLPWSRWEIGGRYTTGSMNARGDLPGTLIPDDDISYDLHSLTWFGSIPWGHRRRGRIELSRRLERRTYTTKNRFDLSRFGRVNERDRVAVRILQRLTNSLDLALAWSRRTNDARFAAGVETEPGLADYQQNRYSLSLTLR